MHASRRRVHASGREIEGQRTRAAACDDWEDYSQIGATNCLPGPKATGCPFAAADAANNCPDYFVRGDANADGEVDMTDALSTLSYLFQGGVPVGREAADVDKSGTVTMGDAISLLNYLFQGGIPPKARQDFAGPSCRVSCIFDYRTAACGV